MTNAEARFNNSLRPRKPEGSLGRAAQDGHLDSHTVPELWKSEKNLPRNAGFLNKVMVVIISPPFGCRVRKQVLTLFAHIKDRIALAAQSSLHMQPAGIPLWHCRGGERIHTSRARLQVRTATEEAG